MRLTNSQMMIRSHFKSDKELYGYELVKISNGTIKIGTVYVLLGRIVDKGFLESRYDQALSGGPRRRLYKLTSEGIRELEAYNAYLASLKNNGTP